MDAGHEEERAERGVFSAPANASTLIAYSKILRGPVFEGITEIEDGKMTLSIETECRQADAGKVKLYLNSELQKLFAKNGIRI